LKIIHEKCDPKLAEDKKLPYTAYLIQYENEGKVEHDIAMGDSQVELFDNYYDKYKKGLKWLKQSNGRQKPNMWNNTVPTPPKKRKKKIQQQPEGE
tara:strand:+ start:2085 stop:2372 length:288 start_codon:yes stop_codon:yes gene_type:complete